MARLRERMYTAALQQEVEYVERGEGDVISRLSVDTSIVGERYVYSPLEYDPASGAMVIPLNLRFLIWSLSTQVSSRRFSSPPSPHSLLYLESG